jgi:AraC family transcriptional regulator
MVWVAWPKSHSWLPSTYYDGLVTKMLACGNPEKIGYLDPYARQDEPGWYSSQGDVCVKALPTSTIAGTFPQDSGSGVPRLAVRPRHSPPGWTEAPAAPHAVVCIHIGPSVRMFCRRGAETFRGTEGHGDINLVPAGLPSAWKADKTSTGVVMILPPALLVWVAVESGLDPAHVEIVNRFQLRDPHLEHLGWALKAEMEAGYPSGGLFLDSLGTALATHLLRRHRAGTGKAPARTGGLYGVKLRQVLAYIEDNLDGDLSLAGIASVTGLSVSHFKTLFRQSVGIPVYQYVIQRRVERARMLLSDKKLSISQIALATGFTHQSHLARHMHRLLGVTPAVIRQQR